MKIRNVFKKVTLGSSVIETKRTEAGVIHILGNDNISICKGLGFAHGLDRLTQLLLTRVLSVGRLTEYLVDNNETFAIDSLMRKMGIQGDSESDIDNLSDEAKQWCEAYCEGINLYIDKYGPPILYKILKLPLNLWSIKDTLALTKMHMYLGLGQAQERIERFIMQAIHDGVSIDHLKKIFSPYLNQIDDETIQLIKHLDLKCPFLDFQMRFEPAFSNNWAISGSKSFSGKPLCACDPHLQVDRLPAFWYEVILETPKNYQMGVTIPGFPGVVMGRSKKISASFTYGMMDTIDFFIEEIKDNHFRREDGWKPLIHREEVLERKKQKKAFLHFFETNAGIIEKKSYVDNFIENGIYIALGWSCAKKGVSPIINSFVKFWDSESVFTAGKFASKMTLSCNWILADSDGNIAYQQSGRLPNRKRSVLFPLPAWKNENLWDGFIDSELLSASYNPVSGFVASANDDKNQTGKPISISVPYANYRYDRICQKLSQDGLFSIKDMQLLQSDLYSLQAEKFLEKIRDLIPDTLIGNHLREWDCCYSKDSKGATLFEAFYFALLEEVFGKIFGFKAWQQISTRHTLLFFIHGHFDRILLSDDENWFEKDGKNECIKKVLNKTLSEFSAAVPTWGSKNQFIMKNIFFSGRLPKFLGFDLGPIEMEGNRASISASFVLKERKRSIAAAATYRCVLDLANHEIYTVLAGGPSEKRYSKYYSSDVKKWLSFDYKKLSLTYSRYSSKCKILNYICYKQN